MIGITSIIGGDEITCLAGLPGAAKAGIIAFDPCNFPVLEPRATCLKTLTWTKRPSGGLLEYQLLPQGPARGALETYVPRLITSPSSWITP